MRATIKKTGDIIEVQDYGTKMYPRYWTNSQGYNADELSFLKDEDTAEDES